MKTSIYLNKDRQAALEASGLTLLDIIDYGLAVAAHEFYKDPEHLKVAGPGQRPKQQCPPHPKGRVLKGYCGRCGRQTEGEKIA